MRRLPRSRAKCLLAYWSKVENDIVFSWPTRSADGHMLYNVFCFEDLRGGRSLRKELEARGYDITTLQFSVALAERAQRGG